MGRLDAYPGSASAGAPTCASPWAAAASGLTVAFPRQSGGPAAGVAEIGCVWALQGRGLRPRRPGKPEGKRYKRRPLRLRSVFNGLVPRATTTWVGVRELGGGCSGEEKGRLKSLSSAACRQASRAQERPVAQTGEAAGSGRQAMKSVFQIPNLRRTRGLLLPDLLSGEVTINVPGALQTI